MAEYHSFEKWASPDYWDDEDWQTREAMGLEDRIEASQETPMALGTSKPAPTTSKLSGMEALHTGKRKSPRRTMIYGDIGVRKSTLASKANKPVFIDTEKGLADIDCESFVHETYDGVMGRIEWLTTADHDWGALNIDTVDLFENSLHTKLVDAEGQKSMEDWDYQKGYVKAIPYWNKFIDALDLLQEKRDMAIILVAHCTIKAVNLPDADRYDQYIPGMHKLATDRLTRWCTEVFFIGTKILTTSEKHFNKKISKAIDGKLAIYTTKDPKHKAKNRLRLPNEITFEQAEQVLRDGEWNDQNKSNS